MGRLAEATNRVDDRDGLDGGDGGDGAEDGFDVVVWRMAEEV